MGILCRLGAVLAPLCLLACVPHAEVASFGTTGKLVLAAAKDAPDLRRRLDDAKSTQDALSVFLNPKIDKAEMAQTIDALKRSLLERAVRNCKAFGEKLDGYLQQATFESLRLFPVRRHAAWFDPDRNLFLPSFDAASATSRLACLPENRLAPNTCTAREQKYARAYIRHAIGARHDKLIAAYSSAIRGKIYKDVAPLLTDVLSLEQGCGFGRSVRTVANALRVEQGDYGTDPSLWQLTLEPHGHDQEQLARNWLRDTKNVLRGEYHKLGRNSLYLR